MAISQNVRFVGTAPIAAESEHPPGASIANMLRNRLSKHGWQMPEIDNWRDSGWVLACARSGSSFQIVLAEMAEKSHWLLQISPAYVPGFFGGLFGRKPSASPADVLTLARDVHQILASESAFGNFKWCWDDYPQEGNSNSEPVGPQEGLTTRNT